MDGKHRDLARKKFRSVTDEATFLEFLSALAMDRHDEVTKAAIAPTSRCERLGARDDRELPGRRGVVGSCGHRRR